MLRVLNTLARCAYFLAVPDVRCVLAEPYMICRVVRSEIKGVCGSVAQLACDNNQLPNWLYRRLFPLLSGQELDPLEGGFQKSE